MTAKAREMQADGINVLSFAAGEPDFNTPQPIIEAAKKALDEGFTKYAPSRGHPLLVEAIQRKTERENGFTCDKNQIVVSCGAKHAIFNVLQVLLNQGDEVLLFAPFWMTYADQILLAGGVPVILPTTAESGYCPHPDQINAAITPRTRAMICNTPSNPTGGAWEKKQIEAVAEIAVQNNITIISDEIYEKITYDHSHTSFASLSKEVANQTVTILGVSKTYSMTGWRIGYSISPPEIASAISNFQDQVTSNATTFAQIGAAAALDSDPSLVKGMITAFTLRRKIGLDLIRQIPGVSVTDPKGAFYFYVNVAQHLNGQIKNDIDLANYLLDNVHIATIPGTVFHGPGHLRISYATNPDTITEGLNRLKSALANLK